MIGSRLEGDDVQPEESGESSERGLVCPQSLTCSSPSLADTSNPESATAGGDIGSGSQLDEIMCDIVKDTPSCEALPTPISPQPAAEPQIHNASQGYMTIRHQLQESGSIYDGLTSKAAETGSEICYSGEGGDVGPTQAAGPNVPTTCDLPAQSSTRDTSQRQAEWQQFSHVEIRNIRSPKAVSVPVEPNKKTASTEGKNIHCSPDEYRPWRLNGTTLSIDIREIGNIPVTVGYSTHRVVDGHLFQTLTLDQGDIRFPSENMRTQRKPHGRGMRKARKSDDVDVSPGPPSCRPLSREQKQYLVRLRKGGHTWNDIASWFPGRKKHTLQQIYYTQLKRSGNQAVKTHQRSKRDTPAFVDPRVEDPGKSGKTTNIPCTSRTQAAKRAENIRYSFRARRIA